MEEDTHFWSNEDTASHTPIPQELITLKEEFTNHGWETMGRMQELSGLTQKELSDLPSNGMIARAFTALLRTWQVHTRSKSIEENPNVPQTGVEDLGKQEAFLTMVKPGFEERQERIKNAPILISPNGSKRHFVGRFLDDYLNPFSKCQDSDNKRTATPNVYGTEYAQLVNIACRKEGLGPWSTFKMTLLASIQRPPGLQQKNERTAQKLSQGERLANETKLIENDGFLTCVPLTVERLRDRNFVESISLKKILRSPSFRASTREFYNNVFPKKS